MTQLQTYIERHGNQLSLAGKPYTVIRIDDTPPAPMAQINQGATELVGFRLKIAGQPGREYWDVFRVSHKRMTRLATFFLDHGVLTEVK
jgi:hypothetical protein